MRVLRDFTTTEVAEKLGVSSAMVRDLMDSGRLLGYRVPGSKTRRIPARFLFRFAREHGVPVGDLAGVIGVKREESVLVLSQDEALVKGIKAGLPCGIFRVRRVASAFEAGEAAAEFLPDCLVVDFSIGWFEALNLCRAFRANKKLGDGSLFLVLPEPCDIRSVLGVCPDQVFKKPVDPALIAKSIKTTLVAD